MKFANTVSNISIAAILAASATLSPAQTPTGIPSTPPPSNTGLFTKTIPYSGSYQKIDLKNGLLAHYPFNGDAQDHSGQQNHGTANGTSPTANRYGHVEEALAFDHDYVTTTDLSKVLTDQLTVTGWLYRNQDASGTDQVFEALTNVWELFLETNGNSERLQLHHSGDQRLNVLSNVIPKERWFHFATVISPSEQSIYIDGKLVQSVPHKGKLEIRTAFRIGRDYEAKIQYWNGAMDDFRIYGRALNEKDIVALRDLNDDMVNLNAGLVAHYPYSGDASDHSGNGNDGKVTGATLAQDRFGMSDSSYAFDGKDDHVFADIENWTGDYTLALWVKADEASQQRYCSLINGYDKTPSSKDTCQIHTSGGIFPTYQFFSGNAESFATVRNEWQHLTVTVNKRVVRFYENGEKVYSQELEGGEANKFSNIIIGRNRNRDRHFEGIIDDIYVYNRAVNDAEVERLFNGGFEDTDGDGLTDDYEKGYGRYQLIKGSYDWKKAKEDAEKRGGHLATITSQAEWEAVREVVGELPSTYWLGGTDEKTEGTWEWITGELWKFTKWSSNEPNNLGNEDYLQTWGKSIDGNRLWNDNQFNENRNGYILEYGYYTDPTLADSDGDRVSDGVEVAAKTDPNNPLSRPAPDRDAPGAPPSAPPGPDYVKKIEELTKDNVAKTTRIEDLENAEKAHLATIAELNATNASLTATVETQKKTIANLNAENADLKQQLSNSREEVVNVSYELTETKEQLQAAIDVARTPFVNGWVYDPEQGWLFTDADHYPLVYSQATQSWHYYELGTAAPRFFYSYKTQEWEAWDPMPEQTETAVASSQSETTNQNL